MKGLLRAVAVFAAGSLAVLVLALGLKLLVVRLMGERLYRLPSLQMERLLKVLPRRPVTDARVLVVGDSTGSFSVDARRLRHAENFATVNTTTIETYHLLKRILDSGASPSCILASYSFQWELNRGFFWNMFVAGGLYSNQELGELERTRRELGEGESALRREAMLFAAKRGWLDLFPLRRIQESLFYWFWGRLHVNLSRNLLWFQKGSTILRDASNFEGSLAMFFEKDPYLTRTELEYLRRTLELAREKGIPFIVLKIPFPQSVPRAKADAYWVKYEQFLLDAAGPFRVLSPPAMPESHYISAGHLNLKGVEAITPYLSEGLGSCFR